MADFKTHWRVGLATSGAGAIGVYYAGFTGVQYLPMLVAVGWVGSIIPDIDSDTSKPRRFIFTGLSILLPPALIYRLPSLHVSLWPTVLFWVGAVWIILYPLKWSFKRFTRHRGAYHTIPAALIYGCLCALLAHAEDASADLQIAISLVATLGFLTHLTLDELWAVDFNGKLPKRKRSFGTALSLKVKQPRINIILYLTLIICGRLWWAQLHQLHPLPETLRVIINAWLGAVYEIFIR